MNTFATILVGLVHVMVRRVWSNCFTVRPNGQFQPFVGRDGDCIAAMIKYRSDANFAKSNLTDCASRLRSIKPYIAMFNHYLKKSSEQKSIRRILMWTKNLFGYLQVKSGGEERTVGSANALVERSLPKLKLPSRGFRRWPSQSWSAKKTRYLGSQSQRGPTLSQHCPTNGAQLFRCAVL